MTYFRWTEQPELYAIAKQLCHDYGMPWYDPRTGVCYPPPRSAPKKERAPMRSEWRYDEHDKLWEIFGEHCHIWMDQRPAYCDRGRWLARLQVTTDNPRLLFIDSQDGWPRYYFDLDRAKLEIEAWLKNRKEWLP